MKVRFFHSAQIEMTESALFYDSRQAGLGADFLEEVEKGVKTILAAPTRWAKVTRRARQYRIDRFPFGIVYAVENTELVIIAVADLRRRPKYWRARLRR